MSRRWARVVAPISAVVDTSSSAPATLLASLAEQHLWYGMPGRQRPARAWVWAARHGVLAKMVRPAVRCAPRRTRPDLDELADLGSPAAPALALTRSAATTVIVFDTSGSPDAVVKESRPGRDGVRREVDALTRAAQAGATPRIVVDRGDVTVQQGVRGAPLRPPVSAAADPVGLRWTGEWDSLASGLANIAACTATAVPPTDAIEALGRVLDSSAVDAATAARVQAAWDDVRDLSVSVLRHGDLSPQNWLVETGGLTGIIDWETALGAGTPGFDMLHAAISWFEQGVGWTPGDDRLLASSFAHAWPRSHFFAGARAATAQTAEAAGVPSERHESLTVTFFARRLGRRLLRGEGASAASTLLRVACAH